MVFGFQLSIIFFFSRDFFLVGWFCILVPFGGVSFVFCIPSVFVGLVFDEKNWVVTR